jgi:predicted DCC family thiol-disulfide oxidoreductase YuxK
MKPHPKNEPAKNFYPLISVYTEMPDNAVASTARGRVFYDADCSFCCGLLRRFGHLFAARRFVFEPLQNAIASSEFDLPAAEFHREIKLLDSNGNWHGGADAWVFLFRAVWWLKPLAMLASIPGLHKLADWIYRIVAANRHCLNGVYSTKVGPVSNLSVASPTLHARFKSAGALQPLRSFRGRRETGCKPVLFWGRLALSFLGPFVVYAYAFWKGITQ